MAASPSPRWDPFKILRVSRPHPDQSPCISSNISGGEPCDILIPAEDVEEGLRLLEHLPEKVDRIALEPRLELAAHRLLCQGWHQGQGELLAQVWLRQIDEWKRQNQERQERPDQQPAPAAASVSTAFPASTPAHACMAPEVPATTIRRAQPLTIGQFGAQTANFRSISSRRPSGIFDPASHSGSRLINGSPSSRGPTLQARSPLREVGVMATQHDMHDRWITQDEYWSDLIDVIEELRRPPDELREPLPSESATGTTAGRYSLGRYTLGPDWFSLHRRTQVSLRNTTTRVRSEADKAVSRIIQLQDKDCSICWERFTDPHETPCGHIFCIQCIQDWVEKKRTCPKCRRFVLPCEVVEVHS